MLLVYRCIVLYCIVLYCIVFSFGHFQLYAMTYKISMTYEISYVQKKNQIENEYTNHEVTDSESYITQTIKFIHSRQSDHSVLEFVRDFTILQERI